MEQAYMDVVQKIQKVEVKNGDILVFNIKTDEYGAFYLPVESLQSFVDCVNDELKKSEKNIMALFVPDKICLSSVQNSESVVKDLKNVISYIEEAINKITDIENGKFKSEVVINMEQAGDPSKRSH